MQDVGSALYRRDAIQSDDEHEYEHDQAHERVRVLDTSNTQ
jgi:hypothetical protein